MTSRERLLTALDHREPDRVPLDLSGTHVTGITKRAYAGLRDALGLECREPLVVDDIQQVVVPHDDVIVRLGVDVKGLFPITSNSILAPPTDIGDAWEHRDEWGLVHRMPKDPGLYYSLVRSPLDGSSIGPTAVAAHAWPAPDDPARIAGLRERAQIHRAEGFGVVVKGLCAGLFEMACRLRGMESFLCDLMLDRPLAETLLDRVLELKIRFWEMALAELGDVVDVVLEADDYGTQDSQLVPPTLFREVFLPRLADLFDCVKRRAPGASLLFHSCGSVREILPDLIEAGVEILNPVHIAAAGMEPLALKRDFGDALSFWGGGVDTQHTLPHGTPAEVRDEVRRNVAALAPGGGYVFNTVHNIQADVPPANMVAMYEALAEYGRY